MDKLDSFEAFLASQSVNISVFGFLINLTLAALLTFLLGLIYQRYAKTLSNRKRFSQNFLLIGLTTMMIITIVKSSLALSLGLVGALSIVRFRVAIKEPEELAYIFLTICIGLGFGADQRLITIVGFLFMTATIVTTGFFTTKIQKQNLFLSISSPNDSDFILEGIVKILEEFCDAVTLTRMDENGSVMEAAFWVEFKDFGTFSKAKTALQTMNPSFNISLLEQRGIS